MDLAALQQDNRACVVCNYFIASTASGKGGVANAQRLMEKQHHRISFTGFEGFVGLVRVCGLKYGGLRRDHYSLRWWHCRRPRLHPPSLLLQRSSLPAGKGWGHRP